MPAAPDIQSPHGRAGPAPVSVLVSFTGVRVRPREGSRDSAAKTQAAPTDPGHTPTDLEKVVGAGLSGSAA